MKETKEDETMKIAIIVAGSLLATQAFAASNSGKYCLRGQSGATQGTESCGYQTMAQCNAAKAGQNDQCFPNSKGKRATTGSGSKR
jgi:hypothetical protein